MSSMNKQDLVNTIADECGISKALAARVVDTQLDTIIKVVKTGGKVTIPGFGVYGSSYRKPRKGRNPQDPTKEINIPGKTVPTWKAGSKFKDEVKDLPES